MNFCSECGRRLTTRTGYNTTVAPERRRGIDAMVVTVCSGCAEEPDNCRCLPIDYQLSSPVINTSPVEKNSASGRD